MLHLPARLLTARASAGTAWLLACLMPACAWGQSVERNLRYRHPGGSEQYLDVHRPRAGRNAPVVLFIHGGSLQENGERRDSPVYAGVCPGLALRGLVCATMDYRLAPTHAWPAMPDDVAAAVRWLVDSIASRGGDPGRIVLVGHSSGCHLAAAVGLDSVYLQPYGLHPRRLAGVVPIGCTLAPWDTAGLGRTPAQVEAVFRRDRGEAETFGTLAWRIRANPSLWIGAHAPPFLVLVAEQERFMPPILEQAARFVRLLLEKGRPADVRILAGRRHMTTTTRFADPDDPVADLVAAFAKDPLAVVGPPP